MAVLTRRRDLDRPLNADEFDADIDNLDDRVTALEDTPPAAISISNITASGDQMTITMSDASTHIVTMPYRRLTPIVWSPGAALVVDNIFPQNGSLYVVTWPHTAGAEFNAGANDGFGHDFYYAILPNPGNSLPDDGELGQVLQKLSGSTYHVGFRFLSSIYVTFDPSSESDLVSDNVAEALEELEAKIATAVGAVAFDAIDVSYSPSSDSGLVSSNVADALDELGGLVAAAGGGGATTLAGLTDVAYDSDDPATGALLYFDGSDWRPSDPPTHYNQTLFWDGVRWKPSDAIALATSGTVNINFSTASANVFTVTPSGDITLGVTSAPALGRFTLIVLTSGSTSRTITFDSGWFKSQGNLVTGTVSDKYFVLEFMVTPTGGWVVEISRTGAM